MTLVPGDPVGMTSTDPLAGYLVYDTFTGANGTILPDHPPDKAPAGSAWINLVGVWGISANKAISSTPAAAANTSCIDAGAADVVVECDLNMANAIYAGQIVRASASNDYIEVQLALNEDLLYVITNVLGTRTVIANPALTVQANTSYHIKTTLSGTSIKVSVDGVELVDTTSAVNQTDTLHGLFQWDVYGATWDNFTVA
jgi:hypothetical protein